MSVDDDLAGGRLTIDLAALVANWRSLAAAAPAAECAAVIKGDAYGAGLEPAACPRCRRRRLPHHLHRADRRGVRAQRAVPEATVLVLNGFPPGGAGPVADQGLVPVLGCVEEVEEWAALGRARGRPLPAALHVDTGMNRLASCRRPPPRWPPAPISAPKSTSCS